MRIAQLARQDLSPGRDPRIPSAILLILQLALQSGKARVDQRLTSRVSQEMPQRVHVYHSARDISLPDMFLPRTSVCLKIIGGSSGRSDSVAKAQQVICQGLQESPVFLCINPVFFQCFAHTFPSRITNSLLPFFASYSCSSAFVVSKDQSSIFLTLPIATPAEISTKKGCPES